jgi:hypothetical protein
MQGNAIAGVPFHSRARMHDRNGSFFSRGKRILVCVPTVDLPAICNFGNRQAPQYRRQTADVVP